MRLSKGIKYRYWDSDNEEFIITECEAEYQLYTGLKDSDGNDVYVGDILENYQEEKVYGLIKQGDGKFVLLIIGESTEERLLLAVSNLSRLELKKWKIVSNVNKDSERSSYMTG